MFTEAELIDAIDQIGQEKHTIQNCERLAALYTVLDHQYGSTPVNISYESGYSNDNKTEKTVGAYGESDFLKAIAGRPERDVMMLIDELIEALWVLNPRLTNSFFDKLNDL